LDRDDARGAFRYKKRGKLYVASKKLVVARIWRKLLQDDAEIAARWASMKDQVGRDDVGSDTAR